LSEQSKPVNKNNAKRRSDAEKDLLKRLNADSLREKRNADFYACPESETIRDSGMRYDFFA
jgi:hypothetical protein